jgi:tetratricopeptide (TPR) repeat protein
VVLCFVLRTHSRRCCFCYTTKTAASSPEEKERFVSSIIRALDSDPDLRTTTANGRAFIVRAELFAETGRFEEAVQDATTAIELFRSAQQSPPLVANALNARAYRVLADVHELQGNYPAAAEALQKIAASNPAMRTKIVKELERLQQRAAASASRATPPQ